jgi:hypothetical protein
VAEKASAISEALLVSAPHLVTVKLPDWLVLPTMAVMVTTVLVVTVEVGMAKFTDV